MEEAFSLVEMDVVPVAVQSARCRVRIGTVDRHRPYNRLSVLLLDVAS